MKDEKSIETRPSNVTYNIMVMVFGNMRNFNRAVTLYEEMKKQPDPDLRPTLNTYINLIHVCARCKNYNKMVYFYHEIKDSNLDITSQLYHSYLKKLIESKNIGSAIEAAEASIDSLQSKRLVKSAIYMNVIDRLVTQLYRENEARNAPHEHGEEVTFSLTQLLKANNFQIPRFL